MKEGKKTDDLPHVSKMPVDTKGIPILATSYLEAKAEQVLQVLNSKALREPQRVGAAELLKESERRGWLRFQGADLGTTEDGQEILGMFHQPSRTIFVDNDVLAGVQADFTLAHEFGHFVLHRHLDLAAIGYADSRISDVASDFVTGKKILSTSYDWIESHANRFASALLYPRRTMLLALLQMHQQMGIRRNLGRIYVDDSRTSLVEFNRRLVGLQMVYGGSKAAIENRLQTLGLIIDARKRPTHISQGMLLRAA